MPPTSPDPARRWPSIRGELSVGSVDSSLSAFSAGSILGVASLLLPSAGPTGTGGDGR